MNKETKYNLIFLAIIMAIVTPGMVMLFIKKMQPGAKPITMRDPVRKVAVYVDPMDLPGSMKRVVTPEAAEWVRSLTPAGENPTVRSETTPPPTMTWVSNNRKFELLAVGGHPRGTQAYLLIWAPNTSAEEGNLETYWDLGDNKRGTAVQSRIQHFKVPEDVRKSFVDLGYSKPVKDVTLLHVVYGMNITEAKASKLVVGYTGPEAWTDSLSISESTGGKRPSMVTGQ
jgi:hypothetical protein